MDESYRDLKSLLGLERVMNRRQERMEQVLALVLLWLMRWPCWWARGSGMPCLGESEAPGPVGA